MNVRYAIATVAVSVCLTGCQNSRSYVKVADGPDLGYAQAKCSNESMGTRRQYIASGSIGFVVGAAIAGEVVNGIQQQEYMKNCMTMQGWQITAANMSKSTRNPGGQNQSRHRFVNTLKETAVTRPPTRLVAGM